MVVVVADGVTAVGSSLICRSAVQAGDHGSLEMKLRGSLLKSDLVHMSGNVLDLAKRHLT